MTHQSMLFYNLTRHGLRGSSRFQKCCWTFDQHRILRGIFSAPATAHGVLPVARHLDAASAVVSMIITRLGQAGSTALFPKAPLYRLAIEHSNPGVPLIEDMCFKFG